MRLRHLTLAFAALWSAANGGDAAFGQFPGGPEYSASATLAESFVGTPQGVETNRLPLVESDDAPATESVNYGYFADEKKTLEQRLADLEKSYKKDKDGADKKKADDAKKPTMKISGRIHLDYWGIPDAGTLVNRLEANSNSAAATPEDRVTFRRIRLTFQGDIPDNMLYRLDLEVANPNSPTIRDCYLGWKELPILQTLLIGNQKRPYGLDHLNSSNDNIFMERPYVVEAFNQDARRIGIVSYGLSENEAWNWRYGAYFMDDIQNDDGTYGSSLIPGAHGDHYQMEFAARLANTFWYDEASDGRGYGHWGVSGSYGDPDGLNATKNTARYRTRPEMRTDSRWFDTNFITNADTSQLMGLEGVLNFGSLHFCGEYQQTWVQQSNGAEVSFHGGYVQAAYFLTGEHQTWDRKTGTLGKVKPHQNFFRVRTCDDCVDGGWGAWQIAARYSHVDLSDAGFQGGVGDSITAGLVWHWNPNARWLFNYVYGSIDQRVTALAPGVTSGDYHGFGCRFQVTF